MPSKDRIAVSMPPELQARLRVYTRETGVPYSELIRRLVVQYLNQQERPCVECGSPVFGPQGGPKGPLCNRCI